MSGQVEGQGGPPALQRELAVWLDGAPGRVGMLSARAAAGGAIGFVYDVAYLNHPQAVPLSVSLPLRPAAKPVSNPLATHGRTRRPRTAA